MAFQFIEVDESTTVVRAIGVHSDDEFTNYLRHCAETLSGDFRALLFDLRESGPPDPKHIRMQAAWFKKHARAVRSPSRLALAFVVTSAAMRFGISASLSNQPGNSARLVTEDFDEARNWCRERVAEAHASRGHRKRAAARK